MARAISSFPVPVSPRTRTVESVGATISTCWSASRSGRLSPMISSNGGSARISLAEGGLYRESESGAEHPCAKLSGECRPLRAALQQVEIVARDLVDDRNGRWGEGVRVE